MAGLLDFLNSDDAALGLGLLAASGPTTDPNQTGFGRVLANGTAYAQGVKRANAELAIKEAEARRKALIENLGIQLLTGGGAAAPAAPGTSTGSAAPAGAAGPAVAGSGPLIGPGASSAGGGGLGALTPAQRQAVGADLIFGGGKGVGGMLAGFAEPKWQNVGGNLVNTNAPGFKGGVQRQIVTGRDGQVYEVQETPDGRIVTQVDPSSLDAFKRFQDIGNVSRATTTPGREKILPGGRMGGQSQAEEIGLSGGAPGGQPAPAGPLIGPGAGAPQPQPAGPATGEGTPIGVLQTSQRELAAIRNDLATKPLDPKSRAMLTEQAQLLQATIDRGGQGQAVPDATAPRPLIGPGAGAAAAPAPLPVQTSVVPGGGTQFSPAEQAAFSANQKGAESVAGQTGTMLKESRDQAINAIQAVGTAQRLTQALDSGKAFTGPLANGRLTVAQISQSLGVGGKDEAERIANTRVALQELSKLTLAGRKQMSGQGAITESESKLAERASSGDLSMTPAELKILAGAAERAARFQYGLYQNQFNALSADPSTSPATRAAFQVPALPDPLSTAAPAAAGIPSGWSVKEKR